MKTESQPKKIKKVSKIFTMCVAIIAICLTLSMADLFSSLITVGGFTFTSSDISLSKYNLYAVYTNSTESKVQADEYSATCKAQGGAGYIYLNDSKFFIIASIYENESDAAKVLENIKTNNSSASITGISIPQIYFSSNLSGDEKTTLENALNIFKTTYKKLYDISVSLDTSLINEVNARLEINQIGSNITTISSNFTTIFNNQMTNNFLNIKLKLNDLLTCIDNLINASSNFPFTSLIKNAYCECLFLYKSLAENLINT